MKRGTSRTYDEITRRTVLEPDGSRRPLPEDIPPARTDLELWSDASDELLVHGLSHVGVEVDRGRIILRGWVRDREQAAYAVRIVSRIAAGADVIDRMHLGTTI